MPGEPDSASKAAELEDFLALRRVYQSRTKRIQTALNKHKTKDLQLGSNALLLHYEELLETTNLVRELEKSISLVVDDEAWAIHEQVFAELMDKLNSLTAYLKYLGVGLPDATTQATPPSSSASIASKVRVKLPQLELPTFSGSYNEWSSYKDLFKAIINDNPSLTAAQKMQYLKTSLKGEASGLIQSMKVTDENFVEAWRIITTRYENKREIVQSHMKKLFSQSYVQHESATKIKQLVDTTNECKRALKVLGLPVQEWDTVLVYLCSERLDSESRRRWALSLTGTDLPTYKSFEEFTEKHVRGLMAAETGKSKAKPNKSESKDSSKSSYTSTTSSATKSCEVCKGDHLVYKCEVFLAADVPARIELVKKHNLCYNCVRGGHGIKECKSEFTCKTCKRKHHSLLHLVKVESSTADPVLNLHVHKPCQNVQSLMSTAIVKVMDKSGSFQPCRVLIDSGSESSFISETCVQRLGIKREQSKVNVFGVNETPAGTSRGKCNVTIFSYINSSSSICVETLILPKVTGLIPRIPCAPTSYPHLKGLQLADPSYYTPNSIDILLGVDVYHEVMMGGKISGPVGTPAAFNTIFGWVLSGKSKSNVEVLSVRVHHTECNTDQLLQKFWEVEYLPQRKHLTPEEQQCETFFLDTYKREPCGRFQVKVPFTNAVNSLGMSRQNAVRRLKQSERRLQNHPEQLQQYIDFIVEYLHLKHMELIPEEELQKLAGQFYYLPHHHVMKEDSSTTKLRVVFDASSDSSTGVSLNDCQLIGPKLQDDLLSLLLRFKLHIVALTADITKMYRQVLLDPSDRDFHRIVWRASPNEPIRDYRLLTVTYGTASAPYLAVKCLQQLGKDESKEFPLAAPVLLHDFYVDDLMSGADSTKGALLLQNQLLKLCAKGGFQLRKWSSNDSTLIESLPQELRDTSSDLTIQEDNSVKTLGVKWTPKSDTFSFSVQPFEMTTELTKRNLLSDLAKIFDPAGWLSPVTIKAKILLQELWRLSLNWDDILPSEVQQKWYEYRNELDNIKLISITRCITTSSTVRQELHGFCDSSEQAYAAVVYLRNIESGGTVVSRMIAAKTKVAPIKQQSLPRLELCGALLLVKLLNTVKASLKIDCDVFGWTDSTIVLRWLAAHPNRWKTFVANRVSEIQETLPSEKWHHVPSEENPADCASRGISALQLKQFHLWWSGPGWLSTSQLPEPQQFPLAEPTDEERNRVVLVHQTNIDFSLIEKYSSLQKLMRVTAYCFRFVSNLRMSKENRIFSNLSPSETLNGLHCWIRLVQRETFNDELNCLQRKLPLNCKSQLKSLHPYIDKTGLLRVGGRLHKGSIPQSQKHPVILPSKHRLTLMIIEHLHNSNLHAGAKLLWSTLQQQFWIIRGRDTIRHFIRRCVVCKRNSAQLAQQLMGSLPSSRVTPGYPFQHCGVDYAGPISIKVIKGRGPKTTFKGYIAVFVCMATKAIHLEAVSDLTTDAFLAALKRFVSRRGKPNVIYSDCGTNFVGADKELQTLLSSSQHNNKVSTKLCDNGILWKFNPPSAPHHGGLWEAGVKSVKHHLRRTVGLATLNFEDLATVLAQIEACLNSRPLCAMSTNPDDLDVLTPGHFLIGQPLNAIPEPNLTSLKENRLSRWQKAQQLTQHFWHQWSNEYLSTLQQRFKWVKKTANVKINDLVLIKEESVAPLKWIRGRIIELHPGSDGYVRVVTLKTQKGVVKRPVVKLCPLLSDGEISE